MCCCVQNFMKIRWFFPWNMVIYIDYKNGNRLPSWNCLTTIRDHPRSLCCWPQLPVKFYVNMIHRSEDIANWIFGIYGLNFLLRPPKWGFRGLWTPKCDYWSSRPQKDTSLRKFASFKLSTVNIRWSELTESVSDTHTLTEVNLYYVHAQHSIGQTKSRSFR